MKLILGIVLTAVPLTAACGAVIKLAGPATGLGVAASVLGLGMLYCGLWFLVEALL